MASESLEYNVQVFSKEFGMEAGGSNGPDFVHYLKSSEADSGHWVTHGEYFGDRESKCYHFVLHQGAKCYRAPRSTAFARGSNLGRDGTR